MSNNPYEPLSDSLLFKKSQEEPEEIEVESTPEQGQSEDSSARTEPEEDNLEEISNGNIKSIIEWVGEDQDRAEQMMTLEVGKGPKARTTLINHLHEVLS